MFHLKLLRSENIQTFVEFHEECGGLKRMYITLSRKNNLDLGKLMRND